MGRKGRKALPRELPFGLALQALRDARGEHVIDMARRLNMDKTYLSMMELGRRDAPYYMVDRIVRRYGLDAGAAASLTVAWILSLRPEPAIAGWLKSRMAKLDGPLTAKEIAANDHQSHKIYEEAKDV
jgi:transcriptional regulator with XRE-family HTH domain